MYKNVDIGIEGNYASTQCRQGTKESKVSGVFIITSMKNGNCSPIKTNVFSPCKKKYKKLTPGKCECSVLTRRVSRPRRVGKKV